MITKAIDNCFKIALERKWQRTYWGFDIHGTMIEPNYRHDEIPTQFYPHAIEVLKEISERRDICTILYTCSHPKEIHLYLKLFENHGIKFDFVNENLEVPNSAYGCYEKKPYFNVLFEDKSGFSPHEDWLLVKQALKKYPETYLFDR